MILEKSLPIHVVIFLFPILIATVRHGGGTLYVLLFLFGLVLGWTAWRSLEGWEKAMLIGFSFFFILVSLSLANTQDFANGLKKVERFIHFPLLIPMYLLLKKYRVETGKTLLFGMLIASVVMFGEALYQVTVSAPGRRAVGGYNSLILGDISMLVVLVVVCALLTVSQNWRHYILGAFVIGMALSASVMSGAVGAWILLPVAVLWFLWVKRKSLSIISLLSILILGTLLMWSALGLEQVKKRIEYVVTQYQAYSQDHTIHSTVGNRLDMWRDSITIWKTHPLLGTGIGDFKSDSFQLFKEGRSRLSRQYGHAHSIYFDLLATTGLIGLIGMIVFVLVMPFMMFYLHWKAEDDPWLQFYALAGMTTIISFAVFGLTEGWLARNPFVRTYLMCILVFMSSIAVAKSRTPEETQSEAVT